MDNETNPYNAGLFASTYHTPFGGRMWDFLNRETTTSLMIAATEDGMPAMKLIEKPMLVAFQDVPAELMADRNKQMVGNMVRQVMERLGYVVDRNDVKVASVPFFKMTRYRPRETRPGVHVWRNQMDNRVICCKDTKDVPPAVGSGGWTYYSFIDDPLAAVIGFDFKIEDALAAIAQEGHFLHEVKRLLRAA